MQGVSGTRTNCSTKVVIVAIQSTPGGGRPLPFATDEVSIVRKLCEEMSLNAVEPQQLTQEVLSELRDCQIFHFAGHGKTDKTDPQKSHLRLRDWQIKPLSVSDLLSINLRDSPPFLAYLSACRTSRIKDQRLFNENLHLISACHLAGFRHVLGTLWEVYDEVCVDITTTIYQEIRDSNIEDGSVCRGLHKAIRKMRNSWLGALSRTTARKVRGGLESLFLRERVQVEEDESFASGNIRSARDVLDNSDDEELGPAPWIAYVHYRGGL